MKIYMIVSMLVFFAIIQAYGSGPGRVGSEFVQLSVGSRPSSIGSAYTAIDGGVESIYWNPAGLSSIEDRELLGGYNHMFEGIKYGSIGYAKPLFPYQGGLGIMLTYLNSGDIPETNLMSETIGSFQTQHMLGIFSYGRPLFDRISVGGSLKIIYEKIEEENATGFAVDLGSLFLLPSFLEFSSPRIGMVFQNIGTPMKFVSEAETLPFTMRLGISSKVFKAKNLTLAIDIAKPLYEGPSFHTGGEYLFWDMLALRLGYRTEPVKGLGSLAGLTTGVGFTTRNKFLSVNYAFLPGGDLGYTHTADMKFIFALNKSIIMEKRERKKKADEFAINTAKTFAQGMSYYRKREFLRAHEKFNETLKLNPQYEPASRYLEKIKDKIVRILEREKDGKDLFYARGFSYYTLGEYEQAIKEWKKFLSLNPFNEEIPEYINRIQDEMEQKDKIQIEKIEMQLKLGKEYYEKGEFLKAKKEFSGILNVIPEHAEAKQYLTDIQTHFKTMVEELCLEGLSYYEKGDYKQAKKSFDMVLEIEPHNKVAQNYIELIEKKSQKQRYIKKEAEDRKSEELSSNYLQGKELFQKGDLEKAISYFEKVVAVEPTFRDASNYLKQARAKLQDVNNQKAEDYYVRGLVEYSNGRVEQAISYWEKTLKLNPYHNKALNAMLRVKESIKEK